MVEGKYINGVKTGDWKRYNEQGIIVLTIRYTDGKTERIDGKKLKNYEEEE
jgi:antitoxin component YwqK of YwqJK toxin-antitoxin module